MLTSESDREEFDKFFKLHVRDFYERVYNLVNKKHAHSLIKTMQRGQEFPLIWGTYKVGDITFYVYPVDLHYKKGVFVFDNIAVFLIMKNLRTQKRIMVAYSETYPFIFSTHAISRYKERLGLENDMDFVDVCKDICFALTLGSAYMKNETQIYGSDLCRRTFKIMCPKGAFLGYFSNQTRVGHAETFLSPHELSKDQQYLNPYRNGLKQVQELKNKIKETSKGITTKKHENSLNNDMWFSIVDRQLYRLTEEERKETMKNVEKSEQDPLYWEAQMIRNKQKTVHKLNREGYI